MIKKIAISIIILTALTAAFVIMLALCQPQVEESELDREDNKPAIFDYEPGTTVTILRGTIENIKGNTLTVKISENEKNPVLQARVFKVRVSDDTKLFSLDKPFYFTKSEEETMVLPLPGQDENKICQENCWQEIEFNSLQKDDTVIGIGNLGEKDFFVVKKIYKIKK